MWIDELLGYLPGEKDTTAVNFVQNQYVGILGQLYITLHDLRKTCGDFLDLMANNGSKKFLAYDGHVSDCGCHLRALMLMELVKYYHEHKQKLDELQLVADICDLAMENTQAFMKKLCLDTPLKDLSLPKRITDPKVLLDAIEWSLDIPDPRKVKYLYYCFVLSQFKTYNKRDSKDSVEIDIDLAISIKNDLVHQGTCLGKGKFGTGCRYLKHAKISRASIKLWITNYQARLSEMSVDFLKTVDPSLSELVELLHKKSHKNVSAIPSYLQFKVLERFWAKLRVPILYTIRYFLDSKVKDLYAIAYVNSKMSWNLQMVSADSMKDIPHIVITVQCMATDGQVDVEETIIKAQEDMRLFWYSFMSQHKQYPFETDYNTDEHLKLVLPKREFEHYCSSKAIDRVFDGLHFVPKHIFLEYPSVLVEEQKRMEGMQGVLFV